VNAYLHCVNRVTQLYSGPDTGSINVSMRDMFADIAAENSDTKYENFFEGLFNFATFGLLDLDDADITEIGYCDISLYVIAEREQEIGPPFVSGSIIASRSINRNIIFAPFEVLNL